MHGWCLDDSAHNRGTAQLGEYVVLHCLVLLLESTRWAGRHKPAVHDRLAPDHLRRNDLLSLRHTLVRKVQPQNVSLFSQVTV